MSLLLQWLDTEQVLSFLQNEGSLDIKLHNLADFINEGSLNPYFYFSGYITPIVDYCPDDRLAGYLIDYDKYSGYVKANIWEHKERILELLIDDLTIPINLIDGLFEPSKQMSENIDTYLRDYRNNERNDDPIFYQMYAQEQYTDQDFIKLPCKLSSTIRSLPKVSIKELNKSSLRFSREEVTNLLQHNIPLLEEDNSQSKDLTESVLYKLLNDKNHINHSPDLCWALDLWLSLYQENQAISASHKQLTDHWYQDKKELIKEAAFSRIKMVCTPTRYQPPTRKK